MCVEIGNSGWQPSLITEFQPIHHQAALLNLRKVITKARPFITAELRASCCLGESWLQQQKCSHVTSPPICIPFLSRLHLPCRVVRQGWMEIWAWAGKSSLKMVQSCHCWPWPKKDSDVLSWWSTVCYLMSLALLSKGDLHFGSGQKLCPPIFASGRTEHQSGIGVWKIPQPFSSFSILNAVWLMGWFLKDSFLPKEWKHQCLGSQLNLIQKLAESWDVERSKMCHHFSLTWGRAKSWALC